MQITPFFINSNICLENNDISSFEKFMSSIAGNTGNSYITYALIKELFGGLVKIRHIQNIYEYDFDNSDIDIDYINNDVTHVFLILQDQIRIAESYRLKLPYKKIMYFISKINKPVVIAGLGANSFNGFDPEFHRKLDPNLVDFLKFLSEHCINIGIRGTYTQEILHNIGIDNTTVIGCPSFYENGRNRKIIKREISDLESVLLTSKLDINPSKFHQMMQDFQEQEIIKSIAFNRIEENVFSSYVELFYNKTYHIFSDIEGWKNFVKHYKFAIGYRLHGAILAINSGVPAICLNGDSRATEMCNFLKIPHNSKINIRDENEIFKIYEELDFSKLNDTYPELYDNFIDFLHKNNLQHYDENIQLHHPQDYIKQPSLNLYSKEFYINLENRMFINKKLNEMICQYNDNCEKLNKKVDTLIGNSDNLGGKLDALIDSSGNWGNKLLGTFINESTELNNKIDVVVQKITKPSFMQRVFSTLIERFYKIARFLRIKKN